jgi:hypothetical protein
MSSHHVPYSYPINPQVCIQPQRHPKPKKTHLHNNQTLHIRLLAALVKAHDSRDGDSAPQQRNSDFSSAWDALVTSFFRTSANVTGSTVAGPERKGWGQGRWENVPGFSADAAISARREVRVALEELKRTALKARGARVERRASILLCGAVRCFWGELCVDGETRRGEWRCL